MAFSTTFERVKEKFNNKYWDSIEDFEEYYLTNIQEVSVDTHFYTGRDGVEREIKPTNHFPKLKEYEVWSEGYSSTGCHSNANLLGKAFARNFRQACDIVMCKRHLEYINKNNTDGAIQCGTYDGWSYDTKTLSDWNCKLYWSEELARKTFN